MRTAHTHPGDPIVAIATAPGRGAVGIVRASGRQLAPLIQAVCGRAEMPPRQAVLLPFLARYCCSCCWRAASRPCRACA
jgi:tRNA modification GTPase